MKKYILGFSMILLCFIIWFGAIRPGYFEANGTKILLFSLIIKQESGETGVQKQIFWNQSQLKFVANLINDPGKRKDNWDEWNDLEMTPHYTIHLRQVPNSRLDAIQLFFYKNGKVRLGISRSDGRLVNYELSDKETIAKLKELVK